MLLKSMFLWLIETRQLIAGLLSSVVIISALAVAYSGHQTRNMYRELQQLEKDHDDLEHEYEKLLLEHSGKHHLAAAVGSTLWGVGGGSVGDIVGHHFHPQPFCSGARRTDIHRAKSHISPPCAGSDV